MTKLCLIVLLSLANAAIAIPCSLFAAPPACGAAESTAIRNALASSADGVRSLFVEYDLFVAAAASGADVEAAGQRQQFERKLTVTEALDASHHYVRTVHWYDFDIYDLNGRAEFDPLCNWHLWTPKRTVAFREVERRALVELPKRVEARVPYIQFYSTLVGVMLPQQRHALESDTPNANPYPPGEYFFPWAARLDDWTNTSGASSAPTESSITRETPYVIDTIHCDVSHGYAIRHREIRVKTGALAFKRLTIDASQFVEVASGLWLPTAIESSSDIGIPEMVRVRRIKVNDNLGAMFNAVFPPGSMVNDKPANNRYITAGGEDLLDFTIERCSGAMRKPRRESWGVTELVVLGLAGGAVALAAPLLWLIRLKSR